jgi:hypothetical protein
VSALWDETWHRLSRWTGAAAKSQALAGQVLLAEGFTSLDPSHPLGGPDGGQDALCQKDGATWVMAVYFPRGQKTFSSTKRKFLHDLAGVAANRASAIAFVSNQEMTLSQRKSLKKAAKRKRVEIYHLDRLASVLDQPGMAGVRHQFLGIGGDDAAVLGAINHLMAMQSGGDTTCHAEFSGFDLRSNNVKCLAIVKDGTYPLYDLSIRVADMHTWKDVFMRTLPELSAPAIMWGPLRWPLEPSVFYRVHFQARNGSWTQDLVLKRSESAGTWASATRVIGSSGQTLREVITSEFAGEFGSGPKVFDLPAAPQSI